MVEDILAALDVSARSEPDAKTPIPEVPRIIVLALDDFGGRLLRSLDEQLKEIPEFKRKLTAFLLYRAGHGFQVLSSEMSDRSKPRMVGRQKRETAVKPDKLDSLELAQQLYNARAKVCSQETQAELLRQGLNISSQLEVYVVTEIKTPAHLQLLRAVVHTVETYLQQFEPILMTGVIRLAEYEYPVSEADNRGAVLVGLNDLLSEGDTSDTAKSGQRSLDRCYVVTRETMNSRSVIPYGEIIDRTAGFLAAHYIDGLRQPRTTHQFLLFGRQGGSSPELPSDCGLCDVFGYADLSLDLNHVLDWCAVQEAGRVLRESFLGSIDVADNTQAWLEGELKAAERILSLEVLTEQLLESAFREAEIISGTDHLGPLAESLSDWREQRRKVDETLYDAEAEIKAKVEQIRQRLERVLAGAVDKQIAGHPQGLKRAEALLTVIEEKGRREWEHLRSLEDTSAVDAAYTKHINLSWFQLSRAAIAVPNPAVFWGRLGFLVLLSLIGVLLGGEEGMALVVIVVMTVIAWIIYGRLFLPDRLRHAQAQYQKDLITWHHTRLRAFVQHQLEQVIANLLKRFARPSGVDTVQESEEWNSIQRWLAVLTEAIRLCQEWAAPWRAVQSIHESDQFGTETIAAQGRELVISEVDLLKYYRRLTDWQPQEAGVAFLRHMSTTNADWWRTCTAQKLASELRRVCRQFYEKRISQEMTSLDYHLLEISGSEQDQLGTLLDALIQTSLPMARFHRLHGRWELPTQRLLIVHDVDHNAFRKAAGERSVQIVGGAAPHKIICIQTVHDIPVNDLAIVNNRQWLVDTRG